MSNETTSILSIAPERNDYCLYIVDSLGVTVAEVPCSNEHPHEIAGFIVGAPELLQEVWDFSHLSSYAYKAKYPHAKGTRKDLNERIMSLLSKLDSISQKGKVNDAER